MIDAGWDGTLNLLKLKHELMTHTKINLRNIHYFGFSIAVAEII